MCVVASRRSVRRTERRALIAPPVINATIAIATMISIRVKPEAGDLCRRVVTAAAALRSVVPGPDVVRRPVLLIGTRRRDVGRIGILGARALEREVLAPR